MTEAPVKVTAEQLGLQVGEEYAGQLEYDLGNLAAFDPAPVEASRFLGEGGEEALLETARAIAQSLAGKLFALPSEGVQGGRLAHLPTPTTVLPREKPIPKPKPLTKWAKFAQEKGIVKRKRSKLVFDDVEQDWKRRHGYKRANDELDLPILEASRADKPGEDPFSRLEKERKARVKTNKKQQADNVAAAFKAGGKGAIAPTLKLASALPATGSADTGTRDAGKRKRKELKGEIKAASRQAGISTASMGKFDQRLEGEKEGERAPLGKRRKFADPMDTRGERERMGGMADKFLRERSDDMTEIKRTVARIDASATSTAGLLPKGRKGGKTPKKGAAAGGAAAGGKKGGGKKQGHVLNRKDPSGRGGTTGNLGKRGKAKGGGKVRKN